MTLVLSLGALVTYSSIPVRPTTLITLGYLIMLMLPLGVGCWLVTGTLIVLTVRWARARTRPPHRPHRPAQTSRTGQLRPGRTGQPGTAASSGWLPARWASAVGIAGALVVAVLAVLSVPRQSATVHLRDAAIRRSP